VKVEFVVSNDILNLIEDGIDRNILVYDCDALAGRLTKRLCFLMTKVAHRNELTPKRFYVDETAYDDLIQECVHNPLDYKEYKHERLKLFLGIPITEVFHKTMKEYLKWYEDVCKGVLVCNDIELMILECEEGTLLGSY